MEVRRANAEKLKAGYSQGKRAVEWACIITATAAWAYNAVRLAAFSAELPNEMVVSCGVTGLVVGALVADFMSGLVHWAADTWGSVDTPFFGTFIRSFREHHVDAYAMCKHDWVETNGDNHMLTIPTLFWMALTPISTDCTPLSWCVPHTYSWQVYCLSLTLLIALTNEFHKQSHQLKPTLVTKALMSCNLILTRQNHAVHHKGDHDMSYCITNGWLNQPLDFINFWRHSESLITLVTGYKPRQNDGELMGKKNA
eukprot:TRINITY_DN22425_c0_g1_i1.p1 TRINITY_DN22425_c0_g1~~TRINITY_DN22425_c0_g1_i1.p1  ORF type:complete len:275 (+),score=85.39 TRINITY_DN22425_c0_g1_i1:62-826(+)